jgi:hypothetical protein
MLSDKIKATTDSICTKTRLQEQKRSNKNLATRLASVVTTGKELEAFIETIQTIQNNSIGKCTLVDGDQKAALLDSINICGRSIIELSIDDTMVMMFKQQAEFVKKLLSAYWSQSANEYSRGVVEYLTILSELTDDPKRSNELLASIKVLAASVPPTKATIEIFIKDVSYAQQIVEKYKLEPTIEDFLLKVKCQRATVEDLTPEVTKWLTENSLTKKLMLSFRV